MRIDYYLKVEFVNTINLTINYLTCFLLGHYVMS